MIRSSQLTDPEEQNGIDIHIQRSTTSEDKSWDDFLARTPGGSHIQTSKWSQVKAQLGWKAFRIIATKDDRTIGGAQVLIRPLTLGRTIGYVPRGPVLEEKQSTLVQQIINAIKRIAQTEKCLMMVVQPPRNDWWFSHREMIRILLRHSRILILEGLLSKSPPRQQLS